MLSSGSASIEEKNQPIVKVLVLSNKDGSLSDNIQSQYNLLKTRRDCEIKVVTESDNATETASKIKEGGYDLVLVDEGVTSWEVIRQCTENKADADKPRFYLGGKASDILHNEIMHSGFSGAVKVTKDGEEKPLLRQAYGDANQYKAQKNTPETKFIISSITKMFTAVAIAKLVEDGKLKYDDTLSALLPDKCPNRESFKDITIRELLSHTSGLGQFQSEPYFKSNVFDFKKLDDFLPMLGDENKEIKNILQPDSNPRRKFRYSNINYLLLGYAIEKASGKDFYKYLKDDVFLKDNMKNTVEIRDGDSPFAISYAPTPRCLKVEVPQWLIEMASSEEKSALQPIAENATKLLNAYKEKMDTFFDSYQAELAEVSSTAKLSEFKNKYKEKFKEIFETFNFIKYEIKNSLGALKEAGRNDISSVEKEKINNLEKIFNDLQENLSESYPTKSAFESAPNLLYSLIVDLGIAIPGGYFRSTIDDMIKFQEALWNGEIIANPEALLEEKLTFGCDLLCMAASPIGKIIPGLMKTTYILSPEGLYCISDIDKPISKDDLVAIDPRKVSVSDLWEKLGGNKTPHNKELRALLPQQQEIIISKTGHTSPGYDSVGQYSYGICGWGEGITQGIGHDGAAPGAISTARRFPNAGITIVTLSNVENKVANTLGSTISKYLVSSCSPKSNIQYFDSCINPHASTQLIQDIDRISSVKSKPMRMNSAAKIYQQLEIKSESNFNNPLPSTHIDRSASLTTHTHKQKENKKLALGTITEEDEPQEKDRPRRKTF